MDADEGNPRDIFNTFCQLRGVQQSDAITWESTGSGWTCNISVPGIAIRTAGIGASKFDAKTIALADYVKILQNSGLALKPTKKRKRKGSEGPTPAAKRLHVPGTNGASAPVNPGPVPVGPGVPGTNGASAPVNPGPVPVGPGVPGTNGTSAPVNPGPVPMEPLVPGTNGTSAPVNPGPVPMGRLQIKRRPCSDAMVGKVFELLRVYKLPEAVQKLQVARANGSYLKLKQVVKFADSIGMRQREDAEFHQFFDVALELLEGSASSPGQRYFGRFVRWALREFLCDAQGALSRAQTVPGHVLERHGSCMQQVVLSAGSKASRLIVKPTWVSGTNCNLQRGDWVLLTFPHTSSPSQVMRGSHGHRSSLPGAPASSVGICAEGEILTTAPHPIEVKITGEAIDVVAAKLKGQTCRLDKIANHVTLSRQLEALGKVCSVTSEAQAHAMTPAMQNQEATWVKMLLLCGDSPYAGKEAELAAGEARVCLAPPGLLLEANASQREALLSACGRQLTLIQGPPGTGKTTTALLLVRAWICSNKRPVLCAADSNIAVDNLVDGCAKAELRVIRVGRPEATRPDLEKYNLLDMMKGPDGKTLFGRHKQILNDADVVCTTCSGADHPFLQHMTFARVLMDEAAQATELAALVPLMKMKPDGAQVTLVGDHRQLPPTISNIEVDVEGFGTSLFERMAVQGVQPYLLNIQYRMHPCISAFPSFMYYNGQLFSGIAGASRTPPKGIAWPVPEVPVTFLPVAGQELPEGTSWSNKSEVEAVEALLKSLCAWDDISAEEIGIITPYAAQARLLRRSLGCPPPGKREVGGMNVEVSSVDGFQGREKDVIIVSTVRANARGNVGFVGDPRRMNVTLTRAKRGLVVVGCFDTLSQDQDGWGAWLHWVQQRGLVAGCSATSPEAAEALTFLGSLTAQQLMAVE